MMRIVVVDAAPAPILLQVYRADGERIEVAVAPLRALRLAHELIEAAETRLRTRHEIEGAAP